MKKLLFIYLAFISLSVFSQNDSINYNNYPDYRPGYIILHNNDTLRGEIAYLTERRLARSCVFRTNATEKSKAYSPLEIQGYRFTNGKYFVSRIIELTDRETPVFLEYLIKGKLNVYFFNDDPDLHYYVQKDGEKFIELPDTHDVIIEDSTGRSFFKKSTKHIGILLYLTQETHELQDEINSTTDLDHVNLINIAKKYHMAVCGDYSCIVYEKKDLFAGIKLDALCGAFIMGKKIADVIMPGVFMRYGLNVRFPLTHLDENLYAKTGLQAAITPIYRDRTQFANHLFLVTPLHFEYLFPAKVVRPKIGYGYNFYWNSGLTQCFIVGADINLNKHLGISVNAESEFLPEYLVIPKLFFGSFLNIGGYYKF